MPLPCPSAAPPGARPHEDTRPDDAPPHDARPATGRTALERRYARLGLAADRADRGRVRGGDRLPAARRHLLSLFQIFTPTLEGAWVGLGNYRELLGGSGFWQALGVTLVWTVGTLSLQIVLGVGMALVLHQNIWFRSLARSLILFPYFVSTVVAVLVWSGCSTTSTGS